MGMVSARGCAGDFCNASRETEGGRAPKGAPVVTASVRLRPCELRRDFGGRARNAGRVAFRRPTAAILGFGTVLPRLGRQTLRPPYPAAFAAFVPPRPAI